MNKEHLTKQIDSIIKDIDESEQNFEVSVLKLHEPKELKEPFSLVRNSFTKTKWKLKGIKELIWGGT